MEYINSEEFLNAVWIMGICLSLLTIVVLTIFTNVKFETCIGIALAGVFTHYVIALIVICLMAAIFLGVCKLIYELLRWMGDTLRFQGII